MIKRIVFIAGTYQPDRCGVAHYTARLREELIKQNVQSTVLTTYAAAAGLKSNVKGAVKDWRLSALMSLAQAIKSTPAELLHIQHAAGTYRFQRSIFLLPLLLRFLGYQNPIITTIHEYGWWEWEPPGIPPQVLEWLKVWGQQQGWWDREDGFLLTGSKAIITTNAEAENVILERLPHLASVVHRIPIGVNIEVASIDRLKARQQLRDRCGWFQNTLIIVFFGFLHPVKGIENLLAAFKPIAEQKPQVGLLLAGGVESLALPKDEAQKYWNHLQSLVAEHALEHRVVMTGYLDETTASYFLSGADIGALPFNHGVTLKSGSLLALLAHGLPVIATRNHSPAPELERLLCLVPLRNVAAIQNTLVELIDNQPLRDRLGTLGRDFVRRFAWSDIVQKHLTIYHKTAEDTQR